MSQRQCLLALGMLWAAGVACTERVGPGECTGDVELQVVEGPVPEFSWIAPCALAALAVLDAAGHALWSFHTGVGRNGLEPPVRYGQLPPGAIEEQSPQPLLHGNGYVVRVFRLEGEGEQMMSYTAGQANFRH